MKKEYKTCLLVEDDPEDQEFFVQALNAVSSNTGCYAVANGEEALLTLREKGIMPDYIFTDIDMPKMNGYEFLQTLKSTHEYRHIPVVVYSSTCSEDHIQKLKRLGAIAIYSKIRFNILPQILDEYFGDRRRPFSIL